jgi:hypothetical protein
VPRGLRNPEFIPCKISSAEIEGNLGVVLSREDGTRVFHPRYDGVNRVSISLAPERMPRLGAGESWQIVVELLAYFSEEKSLISLPGTRIDVPQGIYLLQAYYRWSYHPGLVIRSKTVDLVVRKPTLRDRWEQRRIGRAIRRLRKRNLGGDPLHVSGEILSRRFGSLISMDHLRRAVIERFRSAPLDVIGALSVIEDQSDELPLFLYDLITYWEPQTDGEMETCGRFLEELSIRWPDSFIGDIARQKKRFEEIAVGTDPTADRPRAGDDDEIGFRRRKRCKQPCFMARIDLSRSKTFTSRSPPKTKFWSRFRPAGYATPIFTTSTTASRHSRSPL